MSDRTSDQPAESALGGAVTGAVRVGDTVRRSMGPWSPAIHALLRHLERAGFDGAPKLLGIDEYGREILSYLPGPTVFEATAGATPGDLDMILEALGGQLRRYHDAVRDFTMPPTTRWRFRTAGVEPGQVVCHNDLAPRNTIWRGGTDLAFIDWDLAAPHSPLWDVAHAAWQFVPLQHDELAMGEGWPEPPDRRRRLRILCDSYGVTSPAELLSLVRERVAGSRDGIRRLAAQGDPVYRRLLGHTREMDKTLDFLDRSGPALLP